MSCFPLQLYQLWQQINFQEISGLQNLSYNLVFWPKLDTSKILRTDSSLNKLIIIRIHSKSRYLTITTWVARSFCLSNMFSVLEEISFFDLSFDLSKWAESKLINIFIQNPALTVKSAGHVHFSNRNQY